MSFLPRVVIRSPRTCLKMSHMFFRVKFSTSKHILKELEQVVIHINDTPPILVATKKRHPRKKKPSKKDELSTVKEKSIDEEIDEMDEADRGGMTDKNSPSCFYQQLTDVLGKYSNRIEGEYVILIQVGSFFELYFDQADKYAGLLGLTLTKKKYKNELHSFSGFPDRNIDKYLQIIFDAGLKAVVCEQVQDPVTKVITRPVNRLVTPGTIIDENLRDFHRNNYLMSISLPDDYLKDPDSMKIGVAWCDVSLGQFYILETTFNKLMATVTRINPCEILLSSKVDVDDLTSGRWFPELADLKGYYISRFNMPANKKSLDKFVPRFADNKKLVSTTLDNFTAKEKSAAQLLLHYLDECIPNHKTSFQLPTKSLPKNVMQIDTRAAQDLELIQTMKTGHRVGALSYIIDHTVTNPGARLLNSWLLAPSTDLKEINRRHDFVELMMINQDFLLDLVHLLKKTSDVNRIVRRVDNGRAEMCEFLELSKTIKTVKDIHNFINETKNKQIIKLMSPLFGDFIEDKKIHNLAEHIEKKIDNRITFMKPDSGKLDSDIVRKFWQLLPEASGRMKILRNTYDDLVAQYNELQNSLINRFSDYGYNGSVRLLRDLKSSEFIIELRSSHKIIPKMIKDLGLQSKDKSKSVTRLIDPDWTKLGLELMKIEGEASLEEEIIINDMKTKISTLANKLRQISPIIEFLDTTQAFTNLSIVKNLARPKMDKSTKFDIIDGRHIVVEEGLKGNAIMKTFTTNNCNLDSSTSWVITGPNMGGKSTFLRQNALIAILAQIGSFIPASSGNIGIIDKIFTRVGSSDNIYKHQSTFMVEMNETAIILREATERSLVIVDELGRGTSTKEGIAIAYASLITLITKNKSKVLFATHFGPELYEMIEANNDIKNLVSFYRTKLSKIQGGEGRAIDERILFDHRLFEGVSTHSHALEIADLAGFPKDALDLAQKTYETSACSGK